MERTSKPNFKRKETREKPVFHEKRSAQQTLYGLRPVIEAIEAGTQIDKVLIQNGLQGQLVQELKFKLRTAGLPFQYVPVEKLDRMVTGNHQGVVATISPITYHQMQEFLPQLEEEGRTPFLIMLDHVTDVRNMGAIVRTAECAGADGVIVPDHGSAQINEDAIKTSSGALLRMPICREANLKTAVNLAKQSGLQVVAATEKASKNYLEVDFTQPTLLIMGSEDTGISNELLKLCDERAKLPIRGEVQSLNVSVAAAVFMYEVLRQRGL
ncbi:MAG: 23S rRNA (guanosine(2251)-2'-O)-methyltransferase RlmB [Bacteroidales bacterium]|nr:23S rRNA (guanosine(2251)-2'-O)-methyltransferase RlmB [Bacteroidales bacterium]